VKLISIAIRIFTKLQEVKMMRAMLLACVTLVMAASAMAQTSGTSEADLKAIEATALDYGQGWYAGDWERMESALHPDLAKRVVMPDPRSGNPMIRHMSAMKLVQSTRAGSGKNVPTEQQKAVVTIMEVFGNAAIVKLEMHDWVDFMQIAKMKDRWVIVNVLWEPTPEAKKKWGFPEGF